MNKGLSEKELIAGCCKGYGPAQKELYRLYAPKMFGVVLRYSNDQHTAEDLLQEGFIKVYQNIGTFRNEGSFEGWIRRIFINVSLEHFRRSTRLYPISDIHDGGIEVVENSVIEKLCADDLLALLQKLSPGYRMVFNLYAIEGFSHKEIGKMLNISEGTSKSQLARGRSILQKMVRKLEKVEHEVIS